FPTFGNCGRCPHPVAIVETRAGKAAFLRQRQPEFRFLGPRRKRFTRARSFFRKLGTERERPVVQPLPQHLLRDTVGSSLPPLWPAFQLVAHTHRGRRGRRPRTSVRPTAICATAIVKN